MRPNNNCKPEAQCRRYLYVNENSTESQASPVPSVHCQSQQQHHCPDYRCAWVWKPAGIPAGMGRSFNLDPRSWRVWVRHFAVMGFSPIPAGLQKPASGIVPTVFAYAVQCTFG